MKPKISVIIPVYNADSFLPECLDSIFNQKFDGFEVIAINDGSTDSSPQILEKYAKKYSNFKIIHKENEGQGYAKKVGLGVSEGEYIIFVDNDDMLEDGALEKLYNNINDNQSDVAQMRVYFWDHTAQTLDEWDSINPTKNFPDNTDFSKYTFTHKEFKPYVIGKIVAPWNKVYRKKFLLKYDDFCFTKFTFYEDSPFQVQVLLRADKISICPYILYRHRLSNSNSCMLLNYKNEKSFEILDVVAKIKSIFINEGCYEEYKIIFQNYAIYALYDFIIKMNPEIKNKFYLRMKNLLYELIECELDSLEKGSAKIYNLISECDSYKEFVFVDKYNTQRTEFEILKQHCTNLSLENLNYNKVIKKYEHALDTYKNSINEITNSWSYKIGRAITKTLAFPFDLLRPKK